MASVDRESAPLDPGLVDHAVSERDSPPLPDRWTGATSPSYPVSAGVDSGKFANLLRTAGRKARARRERQPMNSVHTSRSPAPFARRVSAAAFFDRVELVGLEPDDADWHMAPPGISEVLSQAGRGVEIRLEDGRVVRSGRRMPRVSIPKN